MTEIELLALVAVLLCALAVLPGTLGVLMFTHKIAASASGARFVYGHARGVLALSVVIMGAALYRASPFDNLSVLLVLEVLAFGGIIVFGFFMHTTRNFRPVRDPIFISMDEAFAKFGPDEEVVGVIDAAGKPFAFITRLARRPHVVYQAEGDNPFIMSHCILAHSSMSYAMEGRFSNPDIIVTAVLANNMVFYDRSSQCSVIQLHNKAMDGDMALRMIATVSVSLKTWRALYPQSRVWIRDKEWRDTFYLKLLARADVIDPTSPVMVYPLEHETDQRLPLKSLVLGVQIGGEDKTYPVSLFDGRTVINDSIGGTPILVAATHDGDLIQVFDRTADGGEPLTFKASDSADRYIDNETGSEWTAAGECVAGAHHGHRLRPVPHYNKIFWYVWSDFHPGTEIYGASSTAQTGRSEAAA